MCSLWWLQFAHMYQLLMCNKVIFLSYLIITIWTFEFSAQMYRFMMSNRVTFITCLILTLGIAISGPYERISDERQSYRYELPDNHTLDIDIFGPYVQIADVWQGHLSDWLDVHTLDIGIFGYRKDRQKWSLSYKIIFSFINTNLIYFHKKWWWSYFLK